MIWRNIHIEISVPAAAATIRADMDSLLDVPVLSASLRDSSWCGMGCALCARLRNQVRESMVILPGPSLRVPVIAGMR